MAIDYKSELRDRALKVVTDRLRQADLPYTTRLSSPPVDLHGKIGDLNELAECWAADGKGTSAAVIIGPQGTGKTIASCQIHSTLHAKHQEAVTLWIDLSKLGISRCPQNDLRLYLGISDPAINIFSKENNLFCVIFDGLDESISSFGDDEVYSWTRRFVADAISAPTLPKILICARQETWDTIRHTKKIVTLFDSYCVARDTLAQCTNRTGRVTHFQLKSWDNEGVGSLLSEIMKVKYGDENSAKTLKRFIQTEAFKSPRLYGLIYIILSKDLPVPATCWSVTAECVDYMIASSCINHCGDYTAEQRRRISQAVALFLVVSGAGMDGAYLEDILNSEIFIRLAPFAQKRVGSNSSLSDESWEFRSGFPISLKDGKYAICHRTLLLHLAAEGLYLLAAYIPEGGNPPDGEPMLLLHPPTVIYCNAAERVASVISTAPRTFNPGNDFEGTVRHLLEQYGDQLAPNLQIDSIQHYCVSRQDNPAAITARIIARTAFCERLTCMTAADPILQLENEWIASARARSPEYNRLAGMQFVDSGTVVIPAGNYPIWFRGEPFRKLGAVPLRHPIYLSSQPVTVAEYGQYLENNPEVALPRHAGIGWSRSAGQVIYDPSCARQPVKYITHGEAEGYCRWRSEMMLPGNIICRLPSPDEMRIAAWGPEMRPLLRYPSGPFGHSDLLSIVQWTNDSRTDYSIVFGCAAEPEYPDDLKQFIRTCPDLCDKSILAWGSIGFRVVYELRDHDDQQ